MKLKNILLPSPVGEGVGVRLLFLLLACTASINAQNNPQVMEDVNRVVDNTPDSIAKALMARPAPGTTRKGDQPVLFLIGNSTMRNGTLGNGNNGQWGWGYFAHNYYDETKIAVENQALGGMSTRTFYNQLWPAIREALKPGDWVIVSIGHNDGGPIDEGRARSVLKGVGEDSVNVVIKETGVHETVWTYGGYIRKYVAEIRAKGANPILMSLTPRNAYDENGKIVRKPQGPWLEEVSKQVDCPYIDLNEISGAKLDSYGEWKTNYHFTSADKIHTSKFGAELNARSAAEGIMACQHPSLAPLKAMMKNVELPVVDVVKDLKDSKNLNDPNDPKAPQTRKPVVFITGDSTVKNVDKDDDSMWGWGSVAETIFDTNKITIANCAMAGRSTRTFLNEGRWEKVYNSLQPGDFVTIQFGHNDIGDIDKGKMRGTIACAQDTCHVYCLEGSKMYEVVYSFGWYLKKFIQDVREKGATPILVSLTPRNIWKDGKVERRNDTYGRWYREVVEETGVDFVDVHNLTADYLDKKYKSAEKPQAEFYKKDHTHTGKRGALQNAKSFAKGLKKTNCLLKKFLK